MECQATYNRMKHAGVNSQHTQALASKLWLGIWTCRDCLELYQMPPAHRHGLRLALCLGALGNEEGDWLL